ncbi:Uncharacterised protein [Mycobacterium tuberculosis]|nr:Uncharacterised protein [Mycobacterium tuberculosis]
MRPCAAGRNPLATTSRAIRSPCSAAMRRPINDPQSCTKSVTSCRSRFSNQDVTHSTCRR